MNKHLIIKKRINPYIKKISVSGDKSISIRWVIFASLAKGISSAKNLLLSEDVLTAIKAVKLFGIKVKIKKNFTKIYGKGIDGYDYKKNLTINAENSGTFGRLILGILGEILGVLGYFGGSFSGILVYHYPPLADPELLRAKPNKPSHK